MYLQGLSVRVPGGTRTHDIQNHNLTLSPTELRAPCCFLFSGCKGTGNIWFHQTIPALFYKIDVILLAVQVQREQPL